MAANARDLAPALPHSLEAERAILGAILLDSDAFARIRPTIYGEEFFLAQNSLIFRAVARLTDAGSVPDLVTLTEEMQRTGELEKAGGACYLASLMDGVPRVSNVEHYARIVVEKYKVRRFIHGTQWLQDLAIAGNRSPRL